MTASVSANRLVDAGAAGRKLTILCRAYLEVEFGALSEQDVGAGLVQLHLHLLGQ